MSFNIDQVNQGINSSIGELGGDIATRMNSGQEMSEVEMLGLQHSIQRWSIMVNMQTNMQKTWSDGIKAVVSNLR